MIFWPSYIGESDVEQSALCEAYRAGATELSRELEAWVLQSNWPESLNAPEHRGLGASVVIAPGGRRVATLPRDAAAQVVVTLV